MIRSIMLALAESPHDAGARNYGLWLARKIGSSIHLLAVVDISAFEVPVPAPRRLHASGGRASLEREQVIDERPA